MIQVLLTFVVLAVSAVHYLTVVRHMPRTVCIIYLTAAESASLLVAVGAPPVFWLPGLIGILIHLAWRRRDVAQQFSLRQLT